jgi:hypothetical protein
MPKRKYHDNARKYRGSMPQKSIVTVLTSSLQCRKRDSCRSVARYQSRLSWSAYMLTNSRGRTPIASNPWYYWGSCILNTLHMITDRMHNNAKSSWRTQPQQESYEPWSTSILP